MIRPIYEAAHNRTAEDRFLTWFRPQLIRHGSRRLGQILVDEHTKALAPCEWVLNFERGMILIEVKNRSVQFSDFMISERKIAELSAIVEKDRLRGRLSYAIVCVSLPVKGVWRRAYAFSTDLMPTARRVGGRHDRSDHHDTEMCLHYRWEDMVDLGQYEGD